MHDSDSTSRTRPEPPEEDPGATASQRARREPTVDGGSDRLMLAGVIAAMAVMPYVAAPLDLGAGLALQAIGPVTLAALAATAAYVRGGWRLGVPGRPEIIGVLLYGAAALWGAGVGLALQNPARYVASQTWSLLLLPIVAITFSGFRSYDVRVLANGLGLAIVLGLAIQFGFIAIGGMDPRIGRGLLADLPFNIGIDGLIPMVACFATAGWLSTRRPLWMIVANCAFAIGIASMSRGVWAVTAIGIIVTAVAIRGGWRDTVVRLLALGAPVVALCAATALSSVPTAGGRMEGTPHVELPPGPQTPILQRPRRLQATAEKGDGSPLGSLDLPPWASAVEVELGLSGPRRAFSVLWVDFENSTGTSIFRAHDRIAGCGTPRVYGRVISVPTGSARATVGVWTPPGQGEWFVSKTTVRCWSSKPLAILRQVNWRALELWTAIRSPSTDETLGYRRKEAAAVVDVWSDAPPLLRLTGMGLGATFPFQSSGWTGGGGQRTIRSTSYIHNYYLFLGFKLGAFGLIALAGILMIVAASISRAVDARLVSTDEEWLLIAAAVTWVCYLVWSWTSPEIYDFRIAPIWGALIAACAKPGVTWPTPNRDLRGETPG